VHKEVQEQQVLRVHKVIKVIKDYKVLRHI
jgi:hypothetical protein